MGNNASGDHEVSADDDVLFDPFDGADTLGYRVLGVQPNSPASKAGLVSFLDFLVGANQQMLLASGENVEHGEEYPDVDLPALLESNKGNKIEFLVWNMKNQDQRLVELIPDDTWGGAGLLGVTIRLDNYAGAEERLIRVLEIESSQSPAAMAGLVPFHDYILGTTAETLEDTAQFAAILEDNVDRVLELYVYNSQSDLVRTVALMPTLSWGGNGLLGAAVGTGYLHRFPSKSQETTGASVERKVRYVGTSPTPSAGSSPKSSGEPSSKNKSATVVLEPQLEMEAPCESEDEAALVDARETMTLQRQQQMQTENMFATPQNSFRESHGQTTSQKQEKGLASEQTSAEETNMQQAADMARSSTDSSRADTLFAGPPPGATAVH